MNMNNCQVLWCDTYFYRITWTFTQLFIFFKYSFDAELSYLSKLSIVSRISVFSVHFLIHSISFSPISFLHFRLLILSLLLIFFISTAFYLVFDWVQQYTSIYLFFNVYRLNFDDEFSWSFWVLLEGQNFLEQNDVFPKENKVVVFVFFVPKLFTLSYNQLP